MTSPDPDPVSRVRRQTPRDLQRVLVGYLATLLAVLCGVPAVIIGWVAASNCTSSGFSCLGYAIYGVLGAVLLAAIGLPLIAWRFRLGLWFSLLTIALVVAPLVLGDGSPYAGTAFLAPGLAAWVSEPRAIPDPNPLAPPPPDSTSPARYWLPRFAAVIVLSVLVPLLGRVI